LTTPHASIARVRAMRAAAACSIIVTLVLGSMVCSTAPLVAQEASSFAPILERLDREGRVELDSGRVVVFAYDFVFDGDSVEAIAFRPTAEAKYPAMLLIPGYQRTARDYLPMGVRFAKEGFAAVAITQRGFGRSTGAADYVGPKTLAALEAGFHRLRAEPFVDPARMGIFGYSRGAMAASLLAVRMTPEDLRAAAFGAGVYDFKKAYDEIEMAGIRANMEAEAGLTPEAIDARTSITKMDRLACPVLILHGEKDKNVPVSQAYLLRDRLTELKKPFEIVTFPEAEHSIGRDELNAALFPFLKRHLASEAERD
jgi:dipeptidyl aminopeptidase/acylaminoacyl peptidase